MSNRTAQVAVAKVRGASKAGVSDAIDSAVEQIDWQPSLDGARILVKVNGVSAFITPGANTSPWALSGVLALLRKRFPSAELLVADSDSSARRHFTRAAHLWGYDRIATQYNASIMNMCAHDWLEVRVSINDYDTVRVSSLALESDAIVNVPVLKTHTWSGASCAMKNLYGLYDNNRHNYHLDLDRAILELVRMFPPSLTVIDGTVGLEAGGPVMGHPKEVGVVLASDNVVAADAVAFDLMGLGRNAISHCRLALQLFPDLQISLTGDHGDISPSSFLPARQNLNSKVHWWMRHTPGLNLLLKYPPTFRLLSIASTFYQVYWYYMKGRKSRQQFFKSNAYAKQFHRQGSIYI